MTIYSTIDYNILHYCLGRKVSQNSARILHWTARVSFPIKIENMASSKALKENRERIQLIAIVILAVLCIILIIALAVVASKKSNDEGDDKTNNNGDAAQAGFCNEGTRLPEPKPPKSAGVFDDLSEDEIDAVKKYMLNLNETKIVPYGGASVNTNHIYLIEYQQPRKDDVLAYLDGTGGTKPRRQARVVVYMGAEDPPVVQEYLVYPASKPTGHHKRNFGKNSTIPFHTRPADTHEMGLIDRAMLDLTRKLQRVLNESYDGYMHFGCKEKCLTYASNAPLGLESGQRKYWIFFTRDYPGSYLHPIGFQALYNALGNNVSAWHVEKIFYHNQTFNTSEELLEKYNNGSIYKVFIPAPDSQDLQFSTLSRRGDPVPDEPLRPPQIFEPDGKRYTVSGRHIEYMGWSFDFRLRSSSGMQIFDIKFKGERIIYELNLQEAEAFYSGYNPKVMHTNYLDGYWGLGYYKFELVKGVDCPNTATFFDVLHFINADRPLKIKNGICVFELDTGMPLRRHFDNDYAGGYRFYGGMAGSALVVRSITTAFNYDYVFDYIFYPNGVIEVRVGATGYAQATYWTSKEYSYGNQLYKTTAGTVHDHIIHYKVDLDVAGRNNSFQTIDIEVENITDPWYPGRRHVQKVLRRRTKLTEKDALYRYNFETPKYLNFFSEIKRNRNGVEKGYRIQINDVMKMSYPESWPLVNGVAWTLHQLVVTKRKESEDRSSSMYNQADPYSPVVNFKAFYEDNEAIRNQDLVAWVTTGSIHIPHSEDVPNTATASNTFGFFIRPFNYFDEDPSIASTDSVLITPTDGGAKIENYGKTDDKCTPQQYPLKYKGTH